MPVGAGAKCAFQLTLWSYQGRPVLATPEAARLFCRVLAHLRGRLGFHLHAFVVLPDRVRLIVATPDGDTRSILIVAQRLKSRFAREWNAQRGRLGLVWEDADQLAALPGLDQIIRRADLLHRGPVIAGLASRPGEWPWSSARPWAGTGKAPVALDLPDRFTARGAGGGPPLSG